MATPQDLYGWFPGNQMQVPAGDRWMTIPERSSGQMIAGMLGTPDQRGPMSEMAFGLAGSPRMKPPQSTTMSGAPYIDNELGAASPGVGEMLGGLGSTGGQVSDLLGGLGGSGASGAGASGFGPFGGGATQDIAKSPWVIDESGAIGGGAAGGAAGAGTAASGLGGSSSGVLASSGLSTALPIAAIGWMAADYFNRSGDVKSGATSAMLDKLEAEQGWKNISSRHYQAYRLPDGGIVRADRSARAVSEALRKGDHEGAQRAWEAWMATAKYGDDASGHFNTGG